MNINTTNYEAFFLLYIDNELTATQKAAVEAFVQENPNYQKEFTLLQKTVLEVDSFEYEDKALLYRFEEMEAGLPMDFKQSLYRKEAPVVKGFFTNKRILSLTAIAAILFLIIGFNFLNYNAYTVAKLNNANTNYNASSVHRAVVANTTNLSNQQPDIVKEKASANKELKVNTPKVYNNTPSFIIEYPKVEIIHKSNEVFASTTQEEKSNTITRDPNEEVNNNLPSSYINTTNESKINETAETYTNIETEDHDRAIYIANFEIDGDKLRGVTRRVNAFFRRNKTDKEK